MAIIARIFASARGARLRASLCLPLAALPLGACAGLDQMTAAPAVNIAAPPSDESALRHMSETLGRRYDRNPADKETVIAYAAVLRKLQQYAQAAAVLQREAARTPEDLEVLAAFGKALSDSGRLQEAAEVLSRAHTPERPNWSVLSAQGAVADQMGDHKRAQEFYEAALKIAPDEPSILSNLGLSYALSRDLGRAEQTLRRAAELPGADARVRQNYALVLSLRGRFSEAEAVGRADLPRGAAQENVSVVRQTIAQPDTWAEIDKAAAAPLDQRTAALALRPTF